MHSTNDPKLPGRNEPAAQSASGEAMLVRPPNPISKGRDADAITALLDADAFARVLEAGGDPLVVIDDRWRYVYVNDPALPYMRRSREALLGRPITEVFPEIVQTKFWAVYNRAVRERAFLTVEDYFAPLDTWFNIRVLPHDGLLYLHFHDVTLRKRAEREAKEAQERLREAQTRLEAALSAGEIATWTFDIVADRIVADHNLARLFSVSPEDAAGGRLETYLQAIHPDDRPRVAREIGNALQPDGSDHFESEYRVVLPDNSLRWLVARGRVQRGEAGEALSLPGVALDITDRKRAEEAFRVAAERLRLATQSANVGIWDYNPRTGELVWDERCKAAFGLPADAAVDYNVFLTGLHPQDREPTDALVRSALDPASTGSYSVEYRTVGLRDGVERWILAEGQAYFDAERTRAERFVGTVLDITERKRFEETLREQGEFLRQLIQSSPDCIKTLDLDGIILTMSEGGRRLLEMDEGADLCGTDWLFIWPEGDTRARFQAALDAARAGGTGRFQAAAPTFKGSQRWWDVVIVPILGADGRPEKLLSSSRDITEQRHAEAERERLLAESRARAEREALVSRIGTAVRSSLSPAEVQTIAVEALGKALDVDRCYFATVDIGRDQVIIGRDFCAEGIPSLAGSYQLSEFAVDVGEVFGGGRTLIAADTQDTATTPWSEATAAVLAAMRVRSLVNVPFHNGRGDLVAALGVAVADAPREWTPEEVAFIEQVATETREAVEAVRQQQRERNIAEQLQAALQPPAPPDLPGLALASHYHPALAEASVGGDFFDVFPVKKGCYALVVADLSGKGLAAAQQVATVRNMLRFALYTSRSVAEGTTTLHRALVEHNLLAGFATLFVGMYDHARRMLTYVNCGQEPGLIWRAATGQVETLPPTGPVLGGFGYAGYTQQAVSLLPGDVISLFTDGLTEVGPSRKNLLEIGGVSDLLRRICSVPTGQGRDPQAVVNHLIAAVEEFARGTLRDDIALMVGIIEGQDSDDPEAVRG